MVRELPMSGRPKARTVGGALLTPTIPSVERIDEPTEDSQSVRTEAVMPKSNLAALPADMEAQHVEVTTIERRIHHARSEHEAVATTETQAGLFEHEILYDIGLEAMKPQSLLAFLHESMKFRPVLFRDQDRITAHARCPDIEPVDGTDRRDAQWREQLEEVRTQISAPACQD